MSAIPEEEAKIYPDLCAFETNCIDFLYAMVRMRKKNHRWKPQDVIGPATEMQKFLAQALAAIPVVEPEQGTS